MGRILDSIIVILIICWLFGTFLHVAGSFIHLLLTIAIIILIARFLGVGKD